jgi:hypothetical protein
MILLLYVWLSEYWLVAYSVPDYVGETRTMRRLSLPAKEALLGSREPPTSHRGIRTPAVWNHLSYCDKASATN